MLLVFGEVGVTHRPVLQTTNRSPHTPFLLHPKRQEGYNLGDVRGENLEGIGEAIVTALTVQDDQRAIAGTCCSVQGPGSVSLVVGEREGGTRAKAARLGG